ncbi:glutamate decarboxylase [Parashewanella spongiae]|uniref:Glutamate decarboxylase n=1 Tax=Parashewanella spongiae TaxID=342950 RepID=A0A3A6TPJ8_9GAMM|nr:glutamate decarboxylase [Parashewanella spongiae]MCL1078880.1 glutamate decarboxylase [Parashewanella spongiae]RJY17870.1 glutamate decarboxylase [Parashewanella spongiae]
MLHNKQTKSNAGVFTSPESQHELEKNSLPDGCHSSQVVHQLIKDELMLDGNSRQNLATFCQTWFEPEVIDLMSIAIDKNMVDRDEYPQTAEIEKRCVSILSDLWNVDDSKDAVGTSTTGSSEAAMLGGLSLLRKWQAQRKQLGLPFYKPNIVTGPVQVCWHKFARYWDVELREVPMEHEQYLLTPESAVVHCDENTIAVVATLGVTFTGQYDPVAEIAHALDDYQDETGIDIPMHIDAASGGFVAPFLQPELEWDFRLDRVRSINASGHKFGLTPLGVGWIIWHEASDLPEELIFHVNYLGGNMPDLALNFSRPSGQIISQYYNFLHLGREGYTSIHQCCRNIAVYLAEEINKLGYFDIIYNGEGGIPALSWKLKPNTDEFTLYDLADRLKNKGWLVPAYALPVNQQQTVVQRILVKRGFSFDLASLLIEDYKLAIEHLLLHPTSVALNEKEAGSFRH